MFIWALANVKLDSQIHNMFMFNTYKILNTSGDGADRTFIGAQLELSNGIFYPQQKMNPTEDKAEAFKMLLEYSRGFNDYLLGPAIDLKSFQDLYGIFYFDLTKQEMELRSGSTQLDFRFELSGSVNVDFTLYALIMYEEMGIDIRSGKTVLMT